MSVYSVAARHGADESSLQEGGPLVHQAPVTSQVILRHKSHFKIKVTKGVFPLACLASSRSGTARLVPAFTGPYTLSRVTILVPAPLEDPSVLSRDHSSDIVQSRALIG